MVCQQLFCKSNASTRMQGCKKKLELDFAWICKTFFNFHVFVVGLCFNLRFEFFIYFCFFLGVLVFCKFINAKWFLFFICCVNVSHSLLCSFAYVFPTLFLLLFLHFFAFWCSYSFNLLWALTISHFCSYTFTCAPMHSLYFKFEQLLVSCSKLIPLHFKL